MSTTIDRTKELLQQLQDGINKVQTSDEFKRVLMTMSKFRSYSFNNCILIFMQKPTSTRVAGFRT